MCLTHCPNTLLTPAQREHAKPPWCKTEIWNFLFPHWSQGNFYWQEGIFNKPGSRLFFTVIVWHLWLNLQCPHIVINVSTGRITSLPVKKTMSVQFLLWEACPLREKGLPGVNLKDLTWETNPPCKNEHLYTPLSVWSGKGVDQLDNAPLVFPDQELLGQGKGRETLPCCSSPILDWSGRGLEQLLKLPISSPGNAWSWKWIKGIAPLPSIPQTGPREKKLPVYSRQLGIPSLQNGLKSFPTAPLPPWEPLFPMPSPDWDHLVSGRPEEQGRRGCCRLDVCTASSPRKISSQNISEKFPPLKINVCLWPVYFSYF